MTLLTIDHGLLTIDHEPMIIGTGIDIIEVQRVADKLAKESGFKELVFSKLEVAYCERMVNKAEHFAARFAAKEAFIKATGLGLTGGLTLNEIEVQHNEMGKPLIKLHGDWAHQAERNNWKLIHVSLSHTQTLACAQVIIEQ